MTSDQDLEARIDKGVRRLTLDAKVRLLSGDGDFTLCSDPEIALAQVVLSDGPTGVRGQEYAGGSVRCLLPNATLLAQHWDAAVATEVGELLAEEAMAEHTHVVLGPTINLHRTPLGGRLFECYSEDPLLTGHLAAGYVRGLQQRGIAATPKHFLANESETERFTVDSVVDEQALREVYLLPFEVAVSESNPWSIMAAYNKVNGTPSTEHSDLIEGVLKKEWSYDGVVVSDWFAAASTAATANAGLDLVMPGEGTPWAQALVDAVHAGEVAEATIDGHVRRVLRLAGRVGAFGEEARSWPGDLPAPGGDRRREQLRRLAAGGMTVLVNREQTLPLMTGPRADCVALIGRHALDTIAQGGGSAVVRPPHVVDLADGLLGALGADRVTVVDGVEVRESFLAARPTALRDPDTGRPGIRVTARDAAGAVLDSRHVEVCEVAATEDSWLAEAATVELSGVLAIEAATRLRVGVRGHGQWQFTAPGHDEDFRVQPHPGPGGGVFRPRSHVTELDLAPGAVLTAVTPAQPGTRILGLVVVPAHRPDDQAIAEAKQAARAADVAVVVVGLTQEQETEGQDKTTLALPGAQDDLVSAVASVARRTVVVVNAATPVLMPWVDEVDAVLLAGLPGQEAGDAITAALTGQIEPAGRLVTTFPARDGAGPAWSTTPVDGQMHYTEGTALGHRGWYGGEERPLFWFGHGLGYSTWTYESADVTTSAAGVVESVAVAVTNTGPHTSRETVQLYLRPGDARAPVRLIGWAQVTAEPGESARAVVPCDARAQRTWHQGAWRDLVGGTLLVARGLGDVRLDVPIAGSQGSTGARTGGSGESYLPTAGTASV